MAKVALAAAGALSSEPLQIDGGVKTSAPVAKRKTPSELREEQLKQKIFAKPIEEASVLLRACKGTSEVYNGLKKQEASRNPRYNDVRLDELYPVKKSRFRMVSGKENSKENSSKEQYKSLKHLSLLSNIAANKRETTACLEKNAASAEASNDANVEARQTTERCSYSQFRSVTELSSGGERLSSLSAVNMDKAMKSLAAGEPTVGIPAESVDKCGDPSSSGTFCPEFRVSGQKIPLDLTLKTYMRLVTSSSVNWIHRLFTSNPCTGVRKCGSRDGNLKNQNMIKTSASQVLNSMVLHSWVHPESTLPPSLISILVSSAADRVETDFLQKRQSTWEDSLQNLYYMFRKNVCDIFYVCTSHFVVMFTAVCGLEDAKRSCNAYITQSTRTMRAVLKEHDIGFSMPLCRTKIEEVTTEDLVELSEIEKHSLGQTCRKSSFPDIDNTPESFLAFIGDENAHGLYDILLNYRSILNLSATSDVPVLYSPVPFKHAAISSPEIKCMDMKRTESNGAAPVGSPGTESIKKSASGHRGIIEVKDKYIPPWILSSISTLVRGNGNSFEASFVTDPMSIGLNIALPGASDKLETRETEEVFCISGSMVSTQLRSGQLKGFKYSNGSYSVTMSPL